MDETCAETEWAIKTPENQAQVKGVCLHLGKDHARIHDKHGKPVAIIFSTGVCVFKIDTKDKC